jgi:hypothetical protein
MRNRKERDTKDPIAYPHEAMRSEKAIRRTHYDFSIPLSNGLFPRPRIQPAANQGIMPQHGACAIPLSILYRPFASDSCRFRSIDHIRAASPCISNQDFPLDLLSLFQLFRSANSESIRCEVIGSLSGEFTCSCQLTIPSNCTSQMDPFYMNCSLTARSRDGIVASAG